MSNFSKDREEKPEFRVTRLPHPKRTNRREANYPSDKSPSHMKPEARIHHACYSACQEGLKDLCACGSPFATGMGRSKQLYCQEGMQTLVRGENTGSPQDRSRKRHHTSVSQHRPLEQRMRDLQRSISEIGQYVCKIAKEIQMEQDIDLRRRLQELQVVVPPTTCCKCNEIRLQKRHTDMNPLVSSFPEVSTKHLVVFVHDLAPHWHLIGHRLGVGHVVQMLKISNSRPDFLCLDMFCEWIERGQEVSWKKLLLVLEQLNLGAVVSKICRFFACDFLLTAAPTTEYCSSNRTVLSSQLQDVCGPKILEADHCKFGLQHEHQIQENLLHSGPAEVSSELLSEFALQLAPYWDLIGHRLGVGQFVRMHRTSNSRPDSLCQEMFCEWIEQGHDVSWEKLLLVLEQLELHKSAKDIWKRINSNV